MMFFIKRIGVCRIDFVMLHTVKLSSIIKKIKERGKSEIDMGDRINYPDKVATPRVNLLSVKMMLNSMVSNPNARWIMVDIKNFYLIIPLKIYK